MDSNKKRQLETLLNHCPIFIHLSELTLTHILNCLGISGDLAIDDVSVNAGRCSETVRKSYFLCLKHQECSEYNIEKKYGIQELVKKLLGK